MVDAVAVTNLIEERVEGVGWAWGIKAAWPKRA